MTALPRLPVLLLRTGLCALAQAQPLIRVCPSSLVPHPFTEDVCSQERRKEGSPGQGLFGHPTITTPIRRRTP
jgi:hypothetical protein